MKAEPNSNPNSHNPLPHNPTHFDDPERQPGGGLASLRWPATSFHPQRAQKPGQPAVRPALVVPPLLLVVVAAQLSPRPAFAPEVIAHFVLRVLQAII